MSIRTEICQTERGLFLEKRLGDLVIRRKITPEDERLLKRDIRIGGDGEFEDARVSEFDEWGRWAERQLRSAKGTEL